MTTLQTLFFALIGGIFAVWSYVMFTTLADQRRRAARRTGQVFPGLRDAALEWLHWWRAPELARQRRLLIGLTVAMWVAIAAMMLLAPAS